MEHGGAHADGRSRIYQASGDQHITEVHHHGVATPDTRPDQLPPLTVRVVNRARELALLDRWFDPEAEAAAVRVGVVCGSPGVGRLTTVQQWARLRGDRFPDGRLFVDYPALAEAAEAGGGVPRPDLVEAVGGCLRALGVEERFLPDSQEDRVRLFRSRTAGRRLLVVLSGATLPAQVRQLVPAGEGSVVLVTGGHGLDELVLHGARVMELEPLSRECSLELLADRCGAEAVAAEPEAAGRLADFCAGLPAALHLVAARLITGRRTTMSGLAAELADEARRLEGLSLPGGASMRAVIATTYRSLQPDAARLYRMLGCLPGRTFQPPVAAAAADLELRVAERLLDVLADAGLVTAADHGRLRLPDLVRLDAARSAADEETADDIRAAVSRVVRHYLLLTACADRAVREDRLRITDLRALLDGADDPFAGRGAADALAWLEAERDNVTDVLRGAQRYGLWSDAWSTAECFTVLFLHHRHLRQWRESLEIGVRAAVEAGLPAAEARLRALLSRPLMDLGEDEQAGRELEKALACAEVADHRVLLASVLEFSGRYEDRFAPEKAIATYERARALNAEAGEKRGEAIARYFLGCALHAAGRGAEALAVLGEAEAGLEECGDARMGARALAAVGLVRESLGDRAGAMRDLARAASVLRAQEAYAYEAKALVDLADVAERAGAPVGGYRAHLERAFEIYESGGSPAAEAVRRRLEAGE